MFIIAIISICIACISFSDVTNNLFTWEKDSEKEIYTHIDNKQIKIIERKYGSGAIGSDFYDTIYTYQLADWIRYIKPFKTYKFDSKKWQKVDSKPVSNFYKIN